MNLSQEPKTNVVSLVPKYNLRSPAPGSFIEVQHGVAITSPKPRQTVGIPLTQGQSALVSSEDFDLVRPYRWTAIRSSNTWYAKAHVGNQTVYMHRLIKLGPQGLHVKCKVDHRNGNGLDNRRCNLRAVTHAENMMNSVGRPASRKSRYKGVSVREHPTKPYRACIHLGGKQKHLGYFRSEEEAARAYDRAAQVFYGPHARLNFPNSFAQGRAA